MRLDRPFEQLQRDVAREAVADDDVGGALRAGRGSRRCRRTRASLAASSAYASSVSWLPFSGSSPIESSRTSGSPDLEDLLREDDAHVRELEQVLRARVGVRAAVEQDGRAALASGSGRRSPAASRPGSAGGGAARRRASHRCSRPRRRRPPGPRRPRHARRRATSPAFARTASAGFSCISITLGRLDQLEAVRVESRPGRRGRRRSRRRQRRARRRRSRSGARSPPMRVDRDAGQGYGAGVRSGSISRPLYVLQVGQTWCGRLG